VKNWFLFLTNKSTSFTISSSVKVTSENFWKLVTWQSRQGKITRHFLLLKRRLFLFSLCILLGDPVSRWFPWWWNLTLGNMDQVREKNKNSLCHGTKFASVAKVATWQLTYSKPAFFFFWRLLNFSIKYQRQQTRELSTSFWGKQISRGLGKKTYTTCSSQSHMKPQGERKKNYIYQ